MGKSYFFIPWIGEHYQEGFHGLRTLVVGAYHICSLSCPSKAQCQAPGMVFDMDKECPCYKGKTDQEYYKLSKSNEIEIQSFIDKEASYPAYTAFTCYMLGLTCKCTSESRRELWEQVAFTNFLQFFVSDDEEEVPKQRYYEAFDSFLSILDDLKPQIIFAWNPDVKECLMRHPPVLRYIGKADMGFQLEVYLFTPCNALLPQVSIDNLRRRYNALCDLGVKMYLEKTKKYLGQYFQGDKRDYDMQDFAFFLKRGVQKQLLCLTGDAFGFCNEKWQWKTYHKGFFVWELKQRFSLFGKGVNPALGDFFGLKNVCRYPKSEREAEEYDSLLDNLKEWLGIR